MFHSNSAWKRSIAWRLGVLLAVMSIGFIGLSAGVELSQRPDIHEQSFPTRVYYLLGLFVFGGLDLGVPVGGPVWAQIMLWLAYFGAPAITTSAIVESALRILRPQAWRIRRLRNHIVVAGCGRFARLLMKQARTHSPDCRMVVVEVSADSPNLQFISDAPRTEVLVGDITSESLLRSLRLQNARRVLLLTGDDYANLDAASRICTLHPELSDRLEVHVSNLQLLRLIENKSLLPGVSLFNAYRTAASYLVHRILVPHFMLTERLDTVVLAGFGRFGQTVLAELQQDAAGLFQTVALIDLEADLRSQVFEEQVGFGNGYAVHVKQGDLQDPALWTDVTHTLGDLGTRPVFVLCSGSDSINIQTALWLSEKFDDARIVVRCFDQSAFTRAISTEGGFEIVSTADLLQAGFETGSRALPS